MEDENTKSKHINYRSMDSVEYIDKRLDNQQKWFDNKSLCNQKHYKCYKKLEIIATALLPIIGVLPPLILSIECSKILIVIIGAIATILKLFSKVETHYELWMKYRTVSEILKREKFLYLTGTGIYKEKEKPFDTLVERIESILATEHNQWSALIQSIPEKVRNNQDSTGS